MLVKSLHSLTQSFALLLAFILMTPLVSLAQKETPIVLNADGEPISLTEAVVKAPEVVKPNADGENNKIVDDGCVELPPYSGTFTASASRGYWFTAQSDFTIMALRVPTDVGTGPQSIQVVQMAAPPPTFASTTTATTLFYVNNSTDDYVEVNIPVSSGDIIGLLGVRGPGSAKNSYGSGGGVQVLEIAGIPTTCSRFGVQQSIIDGEATGQVFWQEPSGTFCRVEMCTEPLVSATEIGCEGSVEFDDDSETYTLTSDGCYYVNPFTSDQLIMYEEELCGDGEIIAEVTGIDGLGWAGVTMREDVAPGSKKVALTVTGGNFGRREVRTATNAPSYPQQFATFSKHWLKLVRYGSQFIGYASQDGFAWQLVLYGNVSMDECISVGLMVTGTNPQNTTTATFSNVSINGGNAYSNNDFERNFGDQFQQESLENTALQVYPNPVQDELNIELLQTLDADAQLYLLDAQGKILKSGLLQGKLQLDVSGLPSGLYFLRVESEDSAPILKRILVQ